MRPELEEKLKADFPDFFAYGGYPECKDGWFDLLYRTIKAITDANPRAMASQIKEKFGGLRIYLVGTSQVIEEIILNAENESYKTCEECGSTDDVTQTNDGWIRTQCRRCSEKFRKDSDGGVPGTISRKG